MVKIDLITGFLGSGKTTFIRRYAKALMGDGKNIGILENDFGAVNVDMMLLQDLMGEQCELEMVAGGCDYDCHKRRFKTKLISMGMCGYDRVLVEPSGIYDTDEFFDVLLEEPLDRWYEIGNVFVILDAKLEKELSEQSQYLLASQLSTAGKVILSHSQDMEKEEITALLARMNGILEKFGSKKRLSMDLVLDTPWEELKDADFLRLAESGYTNEYYKKMWFDQDEAFGSVYFMDQKLDRISVQKLAETLLEQEHAAYGKVFRIKGFFQEEEGWMEVNATRESLSITPIGQGQDVLIVIGEQLQEEKIKEILNQNA